VSDWRDDEPDDWSAKERNEGVRIVGEGDNELADETRPGARFALPNDGGPTWSASDEPRSGTREPSGPVQLPHWTEPPTGEVPRIRPTGDTADDDFESWSHLSGGGPRFRTDAGDWSESDFTAGELDKDDSMSMGALADDDFDAEEEMYGPPPRRGRRSRGRTQEPEPQPMPGPGHLEGHGGPNGREPREDYQEPDMQRRVITGVVMGVVALVAWAAGRGVSMVLVAIIIGLCAFEMYDAFRKAGYHTATIIGLLGCVGIVAIAYDQGYVAFPLVGFLVVVFAFLWYLFEVVHARPTVNIALTLFVFAYIGGLGAFAGLLLGPDPGGTGLLFGVVICAVGSDIVGYFVGSQMGSTPLLPRISPNKTLEGLIGGAVAALVLGAVVGGALHPWADKGIGAGLALGLVVAITAPLGDLCESMLKRDLGVKDLGGVLPGHGGFLDRFDALLFALPASWFLALQLFT
jgi:phosphatidate cytidylyltransferase